jgi:ubiquinol oxidase
VTGDIIALLLHSEKQARPTMLRRILVLTAALVSSTRAFVVGPTHRCTLLRPKATRPISTRREKSTVKVWSAVAQKEPAVIDEGIYKVNKSMLNVISSIISALYPVRGTSRDYCCFYVLETIARVPYFAYLAVMHLRETLGERSPAMNERMRIHYAEADNELHHLLIMESLGGNSFWIDRLLAQAMACGYFWYVVVVYAVNEQAAYHLSELIEDHAYHTYDQYLQEHGEMLRSQPVPPIATKYYVVDNPFLRNLVHNGQDPYRMLQRRPLNSLYDVFVNIRDDECEHWKVLCNLVQFDATHVVETQRVGSTRASNATDVINTTVLA